MDHLKRMTGLMGNLILEFECRIIEINSFSPLLKIFAISIIIEAATASDSFSIRATRLGVRCRAEKSV